MSVVRGTALANYPSLVAGLGGDPATLLRAAGVRDQDVGNYDAFISIRAAIRAIESAAAVTATVDLRRRTPHSLFWSIGSARMSPIAT